MIRALSCAYWSVAIHAFAAWRLGNADLQAQQVQQAEQSWAEEWR